MSQTQIKIEKNVPLPETNSLPPMPFEKMEVNDSFVVELQSPTDKKTVRQRMYRYQKKNPNVRLSLRKIDDDSVRVYRLADRHG